MKTINVVAALIVHDGRIFATQRGYGDTRGSVCNHDRVGLPRFPPVDALLPVQHRLGYADAAGAQVGRMAGPRASSQRTVASGR